MKIAPIPLLLRSLFLPLVVISLLPLHAGAAPQARPFSGNGILFIRPFLPDRSEELAAIPLYREPGVGRIAVFRAGKLPQLAPYLPTPAGTHALAVLDKKGKWLKVAYDDAGRVGWLAPERWWRHLTWEEFLPGRTVSLLPGLNAVYYRLAVEPADNAPLLATLDSGAFLQVTEARGDWLEASGPSGAAGWFRWRNGDGRLLITVGRRPATK